MSATHIGIPSAAVIPESFAIMSHFDACVPRRSITRSKSNIGTVAPASHVALQMRVGSKTVRESAIVVLPQQHRVRAVHRIGTIRHRLLQRSRLHRNILRKEPRHASRSAADRRRHRHCPSRRALRRPACSRRASSRTGADRAWRLPARRSARMPRAPSSHLLARSSEPSASRSLAPVVPNAGSFEASTCLTMPLSSSSSAQTEAPPLAASLRVTRSIDWMPLVPS